jgi:hypothetical protein
VSLDVTRRRHLPVLGVAAAAALLAACGTGLNAQTQQWYDPTDGTSTDPQSSADAMAVRDLIVVSDGSDARVLATVVNTTDSEDEVVEVRVAGESADLDGDFLAAPGSVLRIGEPADTVAQVDGVGVEPGLLTDVEIRFASAPAVTLEAIVRAPARYYSDSAPS